MRSGKLTTWPFSSRVRSRRLGSTGFGLHSPYWIVHTASTRYVTKSERIPLRMMIVRRRWDMTKRGGSETRAEVEDSRPWLSGQRRAAVLHAVDAPVYQ